MSLNEKKFTALLMKIRDASRKTVVPCIHDLFSYIEREAHNSPAFRQYEDERKTKWRDWGEGRALGNWDMPLDENARKSLAYHLYRGVVECGDAGNGMLHWMYYESFELNFLEFQRDFFDLFVQAMEDVYNSQGHEVTTSPIEKGAAMPDPKKVFIIHGRNVAARTALEQFLRALNLQPVDFDQLAADQGGSAFIGDIVRAGLECAQGIVALFTPDEYAGLRPDHRGPHDKSEETLRWQARPNVIFEAGMAYGMAPQRTVLVTLGTDVALFSDVAGVHVVRLHNAVQSRAKLRQKLIGMNCDIDQRTDAWTDPSKSGDFDACVNGLRAVSPQDPFATVGPAGAGAATSPARPLSDAGALLKLEAWIKKLPDDRYGEAISADQIDNECGLPAGTAERLITQAVTKAGDEYRIRGPVDGIVVVDYEYEIQMGSSGSSRADRYRGGRSY
ncbi:MAG TPA: nucleotide-binding protein [Polyangium sp.]|nr:nucleotide-binding protein [Polyangium sp.]